MRPETKELYPINWKQISRWTINARGNKCETCGVKNHAGGKILTTHHIDYDPANNNPNNLVVLCQGCHLRRQAADLADATRYHKVDLLIRMGQLELPGMELPRARNYVQALRDRASTTFPGS